MGKLALIHKQNKIVKKPIACAKGFFQEPGAGMHLKTKCADKMGLLMKKISQGWHHNQDSFVPHR